MLRDAAYLASAGVVPSFEDALRLSRRRRAALVMIARDIEAQRMASITAAVAKGLGG